MIGRLAAYALIALSPLTVLVPLGPPIAPGIVPFYVQVAFEISDVAALVLLVAAAAQAIRDRRTPAPAPALPLRWVLVAIAGLALITSPFALSPPLAGYSALRWLLAAAVACAIVQVRISPRAAALVLCAGLVPHIVVGIAQAVAQAPLGVPGEFAVAPSHPAAAVVSGSPGWLRAYGLTFHPNVLGGFLCVAILLALPLLVHRAFWPLWWLLWVGLFLTFSRSAWLAAGLALPVAVIGIARRRPVMRRSLTAALAAVAVLACSGAMFFAPQLATRLSPLIASIGATTAVPAHERLSLRYRASMARIAVAAIAEHPVAGIGAGNFPLEMQRQRARIPQYVHNVPLLLAAEVGLLGGALWVAACLAGMVGLAASWRRGTAETIAVLSAWLAIGVVSLFDCYPWSLQAGRVLTAILVGLADRAQTTADA